MSGRKLKGRLSYQDARDLDTASETNDILSSSMIGGGGDTPTAEKDAISGKTKHITNSTHKTIMANTLELNESELEYYEQVVNDLAEQLERMREEKEDLQSISSSLGERLQKVSKQKDDALMEKTVECERVIKEFAEFRISVEQDANAERMVRVYSFKFMRYTCMWTRIYESIVLS